MIRPSVDPLLEQISFGLEALSDDMADLARREAGYDSTDWASAASFLRTVSLFFDSSSVSETGRSWTHRSHSADSLEDAEWDGAEQVECSVCGGE